MGESLMDELLKRLHEAQENMYTYYDGDKQISKEEFERKFNTAWQSDDCVTVCGEGSVVTYHERRPQTDTEPTHAQIADWIDEGNRVIYGG